MVGRTLAALGAMALLAAPCAAELKVVIGPDGVATIVSTTSASDEPDDPGSGFDDIGGGGGGDEAYADDEPTSNCSGQENVQCSVDQFKKNGSNFFWLYHCYDCAGWEAFRRVQEVIDDAWIVVSDRFGSLYDAKVEGYIYTSGGAYHGQAGGPAWAGGHFSPWNNQMHVPAPPGKSGFALKKLLVHELTHFRLHQLTWDEGRQRGNIGAYRFLNEGLAQLMEQRLYEANRGGEGVAQNDDVEFVKLWTLKMLFDQGFTFQPYRGMQRGVRGDPSAYYAQSWATAVYLDTEVGGSTIDNLLQGIAGGTFDVDELFRSNTGMDAATVRQRAEEWARGRVREVLGD